MSGLSLNPYMDPLKPNIYGQAFGLYLVAGLFFLGYFLLTVEC
jgi:hypothetical protein